MLVLKNPKVIIGKKIIDAIKKAPDDLIEYNCEFTQLNIDTSNPVINCKDTEERLMSLKGRIDYIEMEKDLSLFSVGIKITRNSFLVLAKDERDAGKKLLKFLKENESTYPNYVDNITIHNLSIARLDTIISFIQFSDTEIVDISNFGN